jgi:lipopolysaccharide heptosyltransferase I
MQQIAYKLLCLKSIGTKPIAYNPSIAYNYVIMSESFKNILIIKPSSLGDIVLALPALTALRKSFPDAKITWLIRPEFAQLLENHPHLTEIILFDRKLLGKVWFHPRAFFALLLLIRQLRRCRFDVVFDFQGLFRTASLAWLSGCKKRFGMSNARELAHIFYTDKVQKDTDRYHLVDYYLTIIRTAGARELDVNFVLPQEPGAVDSIGRLLKSHDIAHDNYAVLIPGSAHIDKCWPVERFAAIADKISMQFGLDLLATGTEPEAGIVEKLKETANVPIANLAGRTSLSELIVLLKNAKLVVSNDTGPGHIAAALGVPLVLIFGRVNPGRIAPYGRNHCVVAVDPDGRGPGIKSTNPKHDIKEITVEQVYEKVCEQMNNLP